MTSENAPKRAAIYARISNDPDDYAVGVHDQAKRCREFAAQRGWTVTGPACGCVECQKIDVPADVYCDNDLTASGKKKRPHYDRLLADIKAGRVDVVVATHTDRLHRSLVELEGYITACEPRDVETHAVTAGQIDLTTADGRTNARMRGVWARHELERMMERQTAAKRRSREAGLRTSGPAPLGYRLDDRDARGRQIPGVSKGLVIDEAAAAAVRSAYTDVLAGVSLNEVAKKWNDAGFRTARGNFWSRRPVKIALISASNAALIEHDGVVVGKAAWDPIVDEDTWRSARAMLTDPARRNTPGPKPRRLLTGVLICGVCGGRYFGVQMCRGKPKYLCGSGRELPKTRGSGGHLGRDLALLDRFVEEAVVKILRQPDVAALKKRGPDVAALEAKRAAPLARLGEAERAYADELIDLQQFTSVSKLLREKIDKAQQELNEAYRGSALEEFSGADDKVKVWHALPIERKRAVLAALMRVKLLPSKRGRGFDPDAVQILPPDA